MNKSKEGEKNSIDLATHEIWPEFCEIAFIRQKCVWWLQQHGGISQWAEKHCGSYRKEIPQQLWITHHKSAPEHLEFKATDWNTFGFAFGSECILL